MGELDEVFDRFFGRHAAGGGFRKFIMRVVELGIFVKIIDFPLHAIGVVHPKFILFCVATIGADLLADGQFLLFCLPKFDVQVFERLYLKAEVAKILLHALRIFNKRMMSDGLSSTNFA